MRIDGTGYWKEFFLFLFPSSGIPESFYLRNEKKKIFHLHNLTTQFEMPDSSIPETQWWKWVYFVLEHAFEYDWNIWSATYVMSCIFVQPLFFTLEKMVHFSFYVISHTESWLFFMIMLWSQNVSSKVFFLTCNPLGSFEIEVQITPKDEHLW